MKTTKYELDDFDLRYIAEYIADKVEELIQVGDVDDLPSSRELQNTIATELINNLKEFIIE